MRIEPFREDLMAALQASSNIYYQGTFNESNFRQTFILVGEMDGVLAITM
jgi:hypothetical protein